MKQPQGNDDGVTGKRRSLDEARASGGSSSGGVPEDSHRVEVNWFKSQDFNATRSQLDPVQLRNDVVRPAVRTDDPQMQHRPIM